MWQQDLVLSECQDYLFGAESYGSAHVQGEHLYEKGLGSCEEPDYFVALEEWKRSWTLEEWEHSSEDFYLA